MASLLLITFLPLTVSELCSGEHCPVRGQELLQVHKSSSKLLSYEQLEAQVDRSFKRAKELREKSKLLVESSFSSFHSSSDPDFSMISQ